MFELSAQEFSFFGGCSEKFTGPSNSRILLSAETLQNSEV